MPDEVVDLLASLEPWVWEVPYKGASAPGAVPRSAWRQGANCQLFAYEVLATFGFLIPDLYSSDLWDDEEWTVQVRRPRSLDLVLFSESQEPYGAHLGVVVGDDEVLHLCAEVGKPAVWNWQEFASRPRYSVVVGYKRALRRNARLHD